MNMKKRLENHFKLKEVGVENPSYARTNGESIGRLIQLIEMNRELSLCCICAKSENLVQIYAEDDNTRLLLLKIEFCLRIKIPEHNHNWTISICCTCMFRLEVCYQFLTDHNKRQNALQNKNVNSFITMQLDLNWTSQDLKEDKTSKKINLNVPELSRVPTQCSSEMSTKRSPHIEDCQCEHCTVLRHGGLPLLVEVIEKSSHRKAQDVGVQRSRNSNNPSLRPTVQRKASGSKRTKCYCEFCGKEFSHKGDMNKHRRRHTGERPYSCEICKTTFSHASNLLRHQKIHSGVKQFLCPVCEKGFYRKDKLSAHFNSVHAVGTSSSAKREVQVPKQGTENPPSSTV